MSTLTTSNGSEYTENRYLPMERCNRCGSAWQWKHALNVAVSNQAWPAKLDFKVEKLLRA